MADFPLNNSWPTLSKLWMKRWSFRRASECKPCIPACNSSHAAGLSLSTSPPPTTQSLFFSSMNEDQVEFYRQTQPEDADSSVEDISSLRGSQYYSDLEGVSPTCPPHLSTTSSAISTHANQLDLHLTADSSSWSCKEILAPPESDSSTQQASLPHNTSVHVQEPHQTGRMDSETRFPILVRSMSTSRRHSWDVPLSPGEPGRRLSLGTADIDSDGDKEDNIQCSPEFLETSSSLKEEARQCVVHDKDTSVGNTHPRTEILASERSKAVKVSRILETSTQAARAAGDGHDLENLYTAEGQTHMLMVQNVLQELKQYHGAKQKSVQAVESSGSVTWYEFLSNENEDEEERTEKAERGNKKVKRTLSSLKNRMTGTFNKDKGKAREKEFQKDKSREKDVREDERGQCHRLVPGTFSSCATCSLCCKSLQKKQGLQCLDCAVNVHKSCRTLLTECSSYKNKLKEIQNFCSISVQFHNPAARLTRRKRAFVWDLSQRFACSLPDSLLPHLLFSTASADGLHSGDRAPGMIAARGQNSSASFIHGLGTGPVEMDDTDAAKNRPLTDDSVSLPVSTTDSITLDDAVEAELEFDTQDFHKESWSLSVEQQYLKRHQKESIKRQDVIYELIQTEIHHVRTLKIMLRVYAHKMREELQMDERKVERIFPQLESLLEVHQHFLCQLRERRAHSLEPGSEHNYCIHRLGDILAAQFSGPVGERMKESYGEFCSRHNEAVTYYKEQLQNNKKFQNLVRKISNLPIVRRLGVPECVLLVTQRITKYPVLVERIIHNTAVGTDEHEELTRALALIKDTITQVDARVSEYEKAARLRDIGNKLEPKALGKMKDGSVFRKEDLTQGQCRLLHEGTVNWKAASGRLKDVLAVLLTNVLLLLQEKDQKYAFATVDSKPSVISLQKLIVREVAHEEKAMFLICASSNEPEMYEIHTASKEDRNSWMALIRQAVESCPHTEEGLISEQEEARAAKLKEFQERLSLKDAQIAQILAEKLQVFADYGKLLEVEEAGMCTRLLLRGDSSDLQQGESLLKGAIVEVESLQDLLLCSMRDASVLEGDHSCAELPRRADTFGGYDSSPAIVIKNGSVNKKSFSGEGKPRDRSQRARSDPQLTDTMSTEALDKQDDEVLTTSSNLTCSITFPQSELLGHVLLLSQRLYSLQAVISQQESHISVQRASLSERPRGSVLLEQEKQRSLEKQREEMATFQRLQNQHRQEQARWERERERQRAEAAATEARLLHRQEECSRLEARLAEEREELQHQRHKYQQDLERLREATRTVEKDKEWLDQQKRLRKQKPMVEQGGLVSSSFNGDVGVESPAERSSVILTTADYLERAEVPARRESANTLPVKTEVPIHLISTTNQLYKPGSVQQQIPTKLAAVKGKEKGGKGKPSQRTDSSASIDMKHMLPLRLSGKEDGSLRGKRPISPQPLSFPVPTADPFWPAEQPVCVNMQKPSSQPSLHSLAPPPAHTRPQTDDTSTEEVIFF